MEFEVRVQLTTNFLGSGPRKNGVRKLERDDKGLVLLPREELQEDLVELIKKLKLNVGPELFINESVDPPRVNILRRVYNKVRVDRFEGIESRSKLSIYCACDKACPDELSRLFAELGRSRGISQWGRKFNCGRFKLLSILICD